MQGIARIYPWITVVLIYVNDFPSVSILLNSIISADDTNLLFEHKDISVFFSTVNREFWNINEWFISNKLSLNVKNAKFSIFHKASRREDLPLVLRKLFINHRVIKRQSSIKFLVILLDGNLSWKEHLKLTENKMVKNIGLIYKAKPYLNKDSLLALYFCYIHSYISFANLVWGSTQNLLTKDKQLTKTCFKIKRYKSRFYHSKELFESCEILSIYKLNLFNTAVFIHKIKNRTAPSSFLKKFEQLSHSYSARFLSGNYRKPQIKFRISIRGPAIWNDLAGNTEKEIQSSSYFETKIKSQLPSFNTFVFKKLTEASTDGNSIL